MLEILKNPFDFLKWLKAKSQKKSLKKDRYRWKLINAVNNEITATDGENDDNKNSKTLLNREKQMPSTTK